METLYYLRSREDPNNYFLAEVLTRLIIINCNDGKVEIAKTYLSELEMIKENHSADRINLYYNIALLHLKTGVYWKAKESFKKALRLPGLNESLIIKTKKYLSNLGD